MGTSARGGNSCSIMHHYKVWHNRSPFLLFPIIKCVEADWVCPALFQGNKFKGDLLPDGRIKSQETSKIFGTPSAWAIYCKKIVNPDKKSGCGWASVS